jgi:dCTP deaminase
MSLKNDHWIRKQASLGMIEPFEPSLVRDVHELPSSLMAMPRSVISYGTSSYGYDLTLSKNEFKVFKHIPGTVVNPKRFNDDNLETIDLHEDRDGKFFILPGHSYGLGVAGPFLRVPPNITVLCLGKSTYARCGVIVNMTPAEAGWEGHLTLEFSNSSPSDCRVYVEEGICQLLFFEGDPCDTTYRDRQGKYQGQPERVITARV